MYTVKDNNAIKNHDNKAFKFMETYIILASRFIFSYKIALSKVFIYDLMNLNKQSGINLWKKGAL